MMIGCKESSRKGIIVNNINELILKNVTVEGCDGKVIVALNINKIVRE